MYMSNNKRFSKEEIDALSKSPYVKNIREDRLTFTYEFRCIVYDRWIVNPGLSELRKILESFGFSRSLLGSTFSKKMHYRFIGNGRPSGGKNKIFKVNAQNIDKYDDSFLIDSDVFIKSRRGVRFTSEFIDQVYKEYPEISIESQLESYGLDPKRVGYQRIYKLKNLLEDINPHNEKFDSDIINKYILHPYVKRCTSKQFVLNNSFYNEAYKFKELPIDEVLGIFEINGSDLPISVRNRIQNELNKWNIESLSVLDEIDSDFKLRVQYNKMRALEKLSLMYFNRLRNNLPHYTFEQKKVLCKWIKELPHDRYDYSVQSILRLMKKYGCVCTVRKERPELKTNRENLKNNRKPNLLKRRFRLARPNEILLTDVSYLKYSTNKTEYFSCIKDAVTGRIVNHVTSSANDLSLATDTIACLDSTENTLFHSDQGILYFSDVFQNKLKELGYEQSMSRRGNCWDNSSQESYFGHMKDECDFSKCSTPEDVKRIVDEYVYYYNYERPQWSRNKMTPVDYEKYLDSMSDGEYSEYMEIEQEKYDKMMEKAGIKALKRAVELGAFTQEKLELWLK